MEDTLGMAAKNNLIELYWLIMTTLGTVVVSLATFIYYLLKRAEKKDITHREDFKEHSAKMSDKVEDGLNKVAGAISKQNEVVGNHSLIMQELTVYIKTRDTTMDNILKATSTKWEKS